MISLQFSRGPDLSSELIEWFSHAAHYSHVDTIMPDGALLGARSDVIGGKPSGVQIRPPDYLGTEPVFRIDLENANELESAAYYDFVKAQVGKPYDKLGIVGFLVGRDWREPSSWFCSELVAAALESCLYFPYPLACPANKVTPPDIINLLSVLNLIKVPA